MVTKYKLSYSLDGKTFQYYRETGQTVDKEFEGNLDQNTIVKHDITNPPIRARYIRFQPVSWKGNIAMRAEIYGCKVKDTCKESPCLNGGTCINLGEEKFKCTCLAQYSGEICENKITDCYDNPIGVAEIGKIPDAKMTASSKFGSGYEPWFGRLNDNRGDGWCSKAAATNNEWLKVDLGKLYSVCAVATQGDRNGNEWVTAFKLSFSLDGTSWNVYKGDTSRDVLFQRLGDSKKIDQHTLKLPVTARYVRFNPVARHKHNCLRVEVYGTIDENTECVDYMTLSEQTRAQSYRSPYGTSKCDIALSGWYRFEGKAGDRMADSCVSMSHCGAATSGWLKGGHPTVADGVVQRKVCFSWTDACCEWQTYINVRNCGDFYVYKFGSTPLCYARYCGNG